MFCGAISVAARHAGVRPTHGHYSAKVAELREKCAVCPASPYLEAVAAHAENVVVWQLPQI